METEKALKEFYESIAKKRKRLGISNDPAWFRGHSHGYYELVPSLFRIKDVRLVDEKNIFNTFITEGRAHVGMPTDPWGILAIMQHYKVPTRLLDWTDSLHVALFFALKYTSYEKPHLWILNPYRLNAKISDTDRIIYGDMDELKFNYYEQVKSESWERKTPVAIAPSWNSTRLTAQRGYFTVHGGDYSPVNKVVTNCALKVEIPEVIIPRLLDELEHSGTDEARMFPDLEGLALSIRRRFRL
ncbi:FRG domain-containing protein [Oceanospirillum multiglobuliferum]|uniref:FRG domain-containing protein n=1 Tax=Oceanospirillum multiglobuliferum TaxID=64969 RepID=A0A1T4SBU9_9GAMM|nr:FRG domain-containing protein [Oceanospirillum multiglobuliferum]OPX55009.1 hypothetical protein BTE48_10940 [Oceanospirillum multiglobuliferum]SKA25341.1 FRG domain-containing protein [Oceanospirillum multiglobuliferum]